MAVEGLIVDAEVGRIGFRNHTVPDGFVHGSRWDEDVCLTMSAKVMILLTRKRTATLCRTGDFLPGHEPHSRLQHHEQR